MKQILILIVALFACVTLNAQDETVGWHGNGNGKEAVPNAPFRVENPFDLSDFSVLSPSSESMSKGMFAPSQMVRPFSTPFQNQPLNLGKGFSFYSSRMEMPGLGAVNRVTAGWTYSNPNVSFAAYAGAEKYLFGNLSAPFLQNNFVLGGSFTYKIDDYWSVSAFGRYATSPFFYSMATFPYVTTSEFGGTVNYQSAGWGISLGSRYTYDPFARQWQFNPVVMPTFKIGKTKVGVDIGPLMQEGIRTLIVKPRPKGPPGIMNR